MSLQSSSTHSSSGVPSSSARSTCVGELRLVNTNDERVLATRRIHIGHDLLIGRDRSKCQWVLDDPHVSAKHLRIYTVIYENEEEDQLEQLVFAEDLSRNGTFWNGSLIGKGNGGFLLSHDDKLRLSARSSFCFRVSESSMAQKHHFDLDQETEMAHFRAEYVITDRLLGAGAFGRVFMAIEQRTRTQMACKIVDLRKLRYTKSKHFYAPTKPVRADFIDQSSQILTIKSWAQSRQRNSELVVKIKEYCREVEILSQLSHPNIIGLDKVYTTDNTMYMFQDLVTAGDLFSYLESKNGRLMEVETAVIIRQILIALKFLHDQNIVHRDLKPENIMMTSLSEGCRVVLTDFGAARRLSPKRRMVSVVGSEQYAAPEIRLPQAKSQCAQKGYTKAVDMWSVGAITAVLLTGGSAFTDPSTGAYSSVLARTCNLGHLEKSREWRQIGARPKDFVGRLLLLDEDRRMTASQALQHTWFSNEWHRTDFEELYQRTVKSWHPRVVKSPVMEMFRSTLVRHLAPSQFTTMDPKMRPRRGIKPADDQYKPFPFNMHVALWPARKLPARAMSDEVKNAIAEVWTGLPVKKAPRFNPVAVNSKQKQAHTLSLPLHPMSPPAEPLQQHERATSVNIKNGAMGHPSQPSSSIQRNSEDQFRSPDAIEQRGLRRRASLTATTATRKRWRDSMFSLLEEEANKSADSDSSEAESVTHKRPKLATIDSLY